jgi:hypothetical protein
MKRRARQRAIVKNLYHQAKTVSRTKDSAWNDDAGTNYHVAQRARRQLLHGQPTQAPPPGAAI